MSDEVANPEEFSYERIEVDYETYITVRGASEMLGLDRSTVWSIAKESWPYMRLNRQFLIEYQAVVEYAARVGNKGGRPGPLSNESRFHLERSEILVTRPGVITTAGHLARSGLVKTSRLFNFVRRGLVAQRIGVDTIIYEDDWWDFVRREWERPRSYRPRNLPKPDGVIPGPIVPSPRLGVPIAEWSRGKDVGWAERYAEMLKKGRPPQMPEPRTQLTADKLGRPRPKKPYVPPPENPHGPRPHVDRLRVDYGTLITAQGAATLLGLSLGRAIQLAKGHWHSVKLGSVWLIPKEEVGAYRDLARPRGSRPRSVLTEFTGPRSCSQERVEEIDTRPGVLTTTESLTRRNGLHRMAVSDLIRKGLPATRVSKSLLVYEDDFERFTGLKLRV